MPANQPPKPQDRKTVVVGKNGPYVVCGRIPLVRKTQVVSEFGEPLTWKKDVEIEAGDTYELCRCGHSRNKPFCDNTHEQINFESAETADTRPTRDRQAVFQGGTNIIVKRDFSLCMEAGFCANRFSNIQQMVGKTDDTTVRSLMIAMIERCPSGSYTYSLEEGQPDVEPDLPQQIAVVTEMSSEGPIMGPLWVTGYIPVERSDGKPFETRNRVTLCRCGRSKNQPLCDGTHRMMSIKED
jgi:CDGSH-type Zn-finger protein